MGGAEAVNRSLARYGGYARPEEKGYYSKAALEGYGQYDAGELFRVRPSSPVSAGRPPPKLPGQPGIFEQVVGGIAGLGVGAIPFLPAEHKGNLAQGVGNIASIPDGVLSIAIDSWLGPLMDRALGIPGKREAFEMLVEDGPARPEMAQTLRMIERYPSQAEWYMADYIRSHLGDYTKLIGANVATQANMLNPTSTPLEKLLMGVMSAPGATVARSVYAPNRLNDVINDPRNQEDEQVRELGARYSRGDYGPVGSDEALDRLADEITLAGYAFSHNPATNLAMAIANDPLIIFSGLTGLARHAVRAGALARRASFINEGVRTLGRSNIRVQRLVEKAERQVIGEAEARQKGKKNPLSEEYNIARRFEESGDPDIAKVIKDIDDNKIGPLDRAKVQMAPAIEHAARVSAAINAPFGIFGKDAIGRRFLRRNANETSRQFFMAYNTTLMASLYGAVRKINPAGERDMLNLSGEAVANLQNGMQAQAMKDFIEAKSLRDGSMSVPLALRQADAEDIVYGGQERLKDYDSDLLKKEQYAHIVYQKDNIGERYSTLGEQSLKLSLQRMLMEVTGSSSDQAAAIITDIESGGPLQHRAIRVKGRDRHISDPMSDSFNDLWAYISLLYYHRKVKQLGGVKAELKTIDANALGLANDPALLKLVKAAIKAKDVSGKKKPVDQLVTELADWLSKAGARLTLVRRSTLDEAALVRYAGTFKRYRAKGAVDELAEVEGKPLKKGSSKLNAMLKMGDDLMETGTDLGRQGGLAQIEDGMQRHQDLINALSDIRQALEKEKSESALVSVTTLARAIKDFDRSVGEWAIKLDVQIAEGKSVLPRTLTDQEIALLGAVVPPGAGMSAFTKWADEGQAYEGYKLMFAPPKERQFSVVTDATNQRITGVHFWLDPDVSTAAKMKSPIRWDAIRERATESIYFQNAVLKARNNFVRQAQIQFRAGRVVDPDGTPQTLDSREMLALWDYVQKVTYHRNTTARSYTNPEYAEILRNAWETEKVISKSTAQRLGADGLMNLISLSMDLPESIVGLTTAGTGKLKRLTAGALRYPQANNTFGVIGEKIYPTIRFNYNPVFLAQELAEPYILGVLAGVKPGIRITQELERFHDVAKNHRIGARLTDGLEARETLAGGTHKSMDVSDEMESTLVGKLFGPRYVGVTDELKGPRKADEGQSASSRMGKLRSGVSWSKWKRLGVVAAKQTMYHRAWRRSAGRRWRESLEEHFPGQYSKLAAGANEQAHKGGWLKGNEVLTDGDVLAYWMLHKGMDTSDSAAMASMLWDGAIPTMAGHAAAIDPDVIARALDYGDEATLRKAVKEGDFNYAQWESELIGRGITKGYAERAWNVFRAESADDFFKDIEKDLPGTSGLIRRMINVKTKTVSDSTPNRSPITEAEWIATHLKGTTIHLDEAGMVPVSTYPQVLPRMLQNSTGMEPRSAPVRAKDDLDIEGVAAVRQEVASGPKADPVIIDDAIADEFAQRATEHLGDIAVNASSGFFRGVPGMFDALARSVDPTTFNYLVAKLDLAKPEELGEKLMFAWAAAQDELTPHAAYMYTAALADAFKEGAVIGPAQTPAMTALLKPVVDYSANVKKLGKREFDFIDSLRDGRYSSLRDGDVQPVAVDLATAREVLEQPNLKEVTDLEYEQVVAHYNALAGYLNDPSVDKLNGVTNWTASDVHYLDRMAANVKPVKPPQMVSAPAGTVRDAIPMRWLAPREKDKISYASTMALRDALNEHFPTLEIVDIGHPGGGWRGADDLAAGSPEHIISPNTDFVVTGGLGLVQEAQAYLEALTESSVKLNNVEAGQPGTYRLSFKGSERKPFNAMAIADDPLIVFSGDAGLAHVPNIRRFIDVDRRDFIRYWDHQVRRADPEVWAVGRASQEVRGHHARSAGVAPATVARGTTAATATRFTARSGANAFRIRDQVGGGRGTTPVRRHLHQPGDRITDVVRNLFHIFAEDLDESAIELLRRSYVGARQSDLTAKADAGGKGSRKAKKQLKELAESTQRGRERSLSLDESDWVADRFVDYMALASSKRLGGSVDDGVDPAVMHIFSAFQDAWKGSEKELMASGYIPAEGLDADLLKVFQGMLPDGAEGYKPLPAFMDMNQYRLMEAGRYAMSAGEEEAFRLVYYKRGRTWLERSLNHPFLGYYPLSYMWGKILPQFLDFLIRRPFGIDAPLAGLAGATHMWEYFEREMTADDSNFRSFVEDNPELLRFSSLFLPGSPWNMPVNQNAWTRRVMREFHGKKGAEALDMKNLLSALGTQAGYTFGLTKAGGDAYGFAMDAIAAVNSSESEKANNETRYQPAFGNPYRDR